MESLMVPSWSPRLNPSLLAPKAVERQSRRFLGAVRCGLGVDLKGLDHDAREALALNAARLLRQSIGGLQQSLRTRSELKNELRLAQTTVQGTNKNPLKFAVMPSEALEILLQPHKPGSCRPSRRFPVRSAICRRIRWPCSPPAAPPYAAPWSTSRQNN
jgi:type VI secretion system protein ImpI